MYTIDWQQALGRQEARASVRARVAPVVWALGFTSMLTDISSEMVSSILPAYLVLHLRMSPLAFGLVDGLYQGAAALLRVAAGFAGDRWRRHKAVAVAGYALSAMCRLALPAAGQAWGAIVAAVAVDRAGKGIRTAPRDALITLHSAPGDLARSFGVHRALDAAGAMLGPLIAFLVLAAIPRAYDLIFVASFCFAVIGLAVLVLFVRAPAAEDRPSRAERPASLAGAANLLRDRRFRALCLAAGVLSLAAISDAFVFLVLQQRAGFGAAAFPLAAVGVSLVNVVVAVPGGGLADRFGRVRVFLGGHVLLLGVYGMLLLPELSLGHVAACVALLGAYYAATDGVLAAAAGAMLPAHLCGSGLALVQTIVNAGRLTVSLVFASLWTVAGLDTAVMCFLAGLPFALGIAGILLVRSGAYRVGEPFQGA